MGSSSRSRTSVNDLSKEVVERIGLCLDTHVNLLGFRAVCNSWRFSLAPLKDSPLLPLKLPFPKGMIIPNFNYGDPDFYLIESTVYIFQLPDNSRRGWLIKVLKTVDGKLRFLNPLTDKLIEHMPKVLNLLDFRVSQVSRSYHLQCVNPSKPYSSCDYDVTMHVRKILLYNHNDGFPLMVIDGGGQLCSLKSGDGKWTILKGASCNIADIIVYKSNLYAVNQSGETVNFDSSLNETMVSSSLPLSCCGRKKRLVESLGQLFLLDITFEDTSLLNNDLEHPLKFKVYRLDEEEHEWIEVHTLGDRIFFAGDNCCFSVSSQDFGHDEFRGNCIYYVNGADEYYYDDDDGGCYGGFCCGCDCGYDSSPSVGVIGGDIYDYIDDFGLDIAVSSNSKNAKNRSTSGCGSNTNDKNEGRTKSGGLSDEVLLRYKGHNMGVFTIQDGKLGPLLSSLDYADIFCPPPSWRNTPSYDLEVAES